MIADRAQLRQDLRAQRRAIAPAARIRAAERFAAHVLSLPFLPGTGYLAGYWAVDGEVALHALQVNLPAGLVYCLPVLHADQHLRFAPWRPGDALRNNRHGIPEPDVETASLLQAEQMSAVIVPTVGFDARGHRLGMGGGWYDRSFAFRQTRKPPPWLIGAAFAMQQVETLMHEDWDVSLDAVCTETNTHVFIPKQHN